MYTATFQSGLLTLKIVNEFRLFFLSIFSIHISGPAMYRSQSKSLIGFHLHVYIYCHVVNFEFTGWV